jgi:hypothetical protein
VTPSVLEDSSERSWGFAWGDYDNDGDHDLYPPTEYSGNKLVRNDGGGVFIDVTPPVLASDGGYSATWADYDNDGDLDIYVVSYYTQGHYFRNDDGVFTDATSGDLDSRCCGYCVVAGDYDNDRDLDLYVVVTNEVLLRNDGGGVFIDVTPPELERVCNTRCASWGDYDSDGDLDIYQGNMMPINTANNLYRNDGGGSFTDVATGPLASTEDTHGVARGDYDNDGDLDIFVVNYQGPNKLLRNNLTSDNHWLQVDLVGTFSNRSGIGTRIRVVTGGLSQNREVAAVTGGRAQGSLTAEFGLARPRSWIRSK